MKVITAPEPLTEAPTVFAAGGITGCPDWQADFIEMLEGSPGVLANPRRPSFDVRDPNAGPEQVEWEYAALKDSSAISFWFCAATLCPITLYELGAATASEKIITVGVEPGYAREFDVRYQLGLARPTLHVCSSLEALASNVGTYARWKVWFDRVEEGRM